MKKKVNVSFQFAGLIFLVCAHCPGIYSNAIPDYPSSTFTVSFSEDAEPINRKPVKKSGLSSENPEKLFFSEYIEGSSNNKALEIFNPGDEVVDLKHYRISQSVNGNGWRHFHTFPEEALIQPKSVWIIIHNKTQEELFDITGKNQLESIATNLMTFNGNDARGLVRIDDEDTILIDVIGVPDEDPGNGWDVAGIKDATMNRTLIRKPHIQKGNPVWLSSAGTSEEDSEWIVKSMDDFSDLGAHSFDQDNISRITDPSISRIDIRIFPNPASDVLIFESKLADGTITFTDLSGRQFKHIHYTGNRAEIDISDLQNGLYMLTVKNSGGTEVRRLVVSRGL